MIGIITTVSTTGYLALLIILFLSYRYRTPKINLWVLAIIPLSIILIVSVPVLGDKIMHTFKDDMQENRPKNLKKLAHAYLHEKLDKQIPLNRFSSMAIIYNVFGDDLILGVSNKYDVILNKTYNVNISNGVFDFLAKFGLVGLIFVIYKYARSSLYYLKRTELVIYVVIIFLIIGTGEPIISLPFILIFLFIPYPQIVLAAYNSRRNSVNPIVKKFNPLPILNERSRN
jgi:hypothetical protein